MRAGIGLMVVALWSAAVTAEPFELGLWLGQASTDVRGNSADIMSADIVGVDDNDTSWGVELGYALTDDFGLTLGYVDQGEGTLVLQADTITPAAYHQQVREVAPLLAEGVTLGGALRFPVAEQFSLFAEAGAFFWESKVKSSNGTETLKTNFDGTDMYVGTGASYHWSPQWSASVRYRYYHLDETVNDWSVGLSYRF
ncbi:outer membrane beta-barrel protein [Shewanella cyperi]|uniref:outer membrane beta-barrel protein n=1 Tax=Shewanella cyperi TaxID=2814292 RepID=UPI001A94A283|nr:outer membrane beta-barrel protein [Shewanella cyperi]QSX41004.1 outer membrane beta-barrel protein [Shewanella cyperi]QSX41006.1 outer membrane beta-barrel protein [Shewanella cyperi]